MIVAPLTSKLAAEPNPTPCQLRMPMLSSARIFPHSGSFVPDDRQVEDEEAPALAVAVEIE